MKQTTLYFTNSGSDKVYQANINKVDGGHTVTFSYGRRGSSLKNGSKTSEPVDLEKATKIFDKLIKSKKAKGYTEGEDGTAYSQTDKENEFSGINCQLLNPIDNAEAGRLCRDNNYCAQAKHDGERRMIEVKDGVAQGINRKSLYIALSSVIAKAALDIETNDYIIDGEDMGDLLIAFDLLRDNGKDIRHLPYSERYTRLQNLLATADSNMIRATESAVTTEAKQQLLQKLEVEKHEGIVFKRIDAPYSAGKPSSGGDQFKYKFYTECSVVVDTVNEGKRSVSFYAYNKDEKVSLGNVTIPPNKKIPQPEAIIEIKYLYAYRGGSLYQPTYLKERTDLDITDCSVRQLKYKAEGIAA